MVEVCDYVAARRYLAPLANSLWGWDDEGQVVQWVDGPTVAFRGEIEHVLCRLAPRGLPPMNALVLLLAACRDNWDEISSQFGTTVGRMASAERSDLPVWLPAILRRLDAVHALPAELRHSPEAKADLAELVFEDSPFRTSAEEAALVTRGLASSTVPSMLASQYRSSRFLHDTLRELRSLHDGLERVDADALRLRRRTGLDQLIRPAELDLAPTDRIRRLIAELRDDEELGGVSRMAGQLLAAMHLPRPIADREDLPVGGVSDIANRGPLDRLLLSELAHDDLTLAVRIAVGEALYLRREAPPRNPPRHRAVLIDAGIRLWGVPRVFATAVALAMAATADRRIQVDVYRAQGREVVPVDFTRREGLIEHLGALTPDAHPGNALAPFLAAVSARGPQADVVVVTGEDVAADADFRRALAALEAPSLLLATVNRAGRFRLVCRGARSQQVVSEARLRLDELLAPRLPVSRLIDKGLSQGLPAILAVKPFPLLLGYQPVDPQRHWAVAGHGVLGVSPHRCLMHWQRPGYGARLLADKIPHGPIQWVAAGPDMSTSLAVVGQLQQGALWLLSVDLVAGTCDVTPLYTGPQRPIAVCGHGGMIFVVYADHVDLIAPASGCQVQSIAIPAGVQWRRDRFFFGKNNWYAISHDGLSARLEPILDGEPFPRHLFLTFLDVVGHDGPVGAHSLGYLYLSSEKRMVQVAHGLAGKLKLQAVARDGHRIVVAEADCPSKQALIEIPRGTARRIQGDAAMWVEPEIQQGVRPRAVRHRIRAICLDEAGHLTLVSTKGSRSQFTFDARSHQIMLQPAAAVATNGTPLAFEPIQSPPDVGYSLQAATWNDGSRAVLDSRGMLHLRSSDASLPEMTLVLADGAVAGWCANGLIWGTAYYTRDLDNTTAGAVYSEILEPFLRDCGDHGPPANAIQPHAPAATSRLADSRPQ